MLSQLVFLPPAASGLVLIGLLVFGIVEFRQGHIGRIGIFANSILLWQIFFASFSLLPSWLQIYLNIGTFIGIVALLAYAVGQKLPKEFYQVGFVLYGSFSILILVAMFLMGKVPVF